MKLFSLLISLAVFIFCSCKKESTSNCNNVNGAAITSNSPVQIGEDIVFSIPEVGGYRTYSWTGPNNFNSQYPDNSISYAELKYEGWYYVGINSLDGDCQKFDSVYIDVQLQQGTPSCTVAPNSTTYATLFDDTYVLVTKYVETTYGLKMLEGFGTNDDLAVYFHPRWRDAEPEDGIYTTYSSPVFGQLDANYNKVFITTTKNSIYWSSHEGQTVYISHVGSKLQVRFCDLTMSGYNGVSYTTSASGNLIED
jgi:hypothetical protein